MCGIAGSLSLDGAAIPRQRLSAMIAQLRHRGPDGVGLFAAGPVGLAHARLSIIDLEGGAQPIHNEDRSVWVVFNGEIFNYLELRAELETRGHRFYTRSDTEVIVHLYEERGVGFLDALNGQFAIALWDDRRQQLLLARDRVGIAPLYYTQRAGQLLFSSEVKAILAACDEAPRLNLRALDQVFTFWTAVAPETLFEDVYEVPPGEWVRVRDGRVERGRWWDFDFPLDNAFDLRSEESLAEELRARLTAACGLRLRADVPVGAYLSGGLDSSVIAALVHEVQPAKLRTFSIGFDHAQLDERGFQAAMVAHLGTDHHSFACAHAAVAEQLAETVWHTESTVLRTAPVPMRLLSARVRAQGYRVVLTGEGADEVLGGYDIFKEAKVRRFWAAQPLSSRRPLLLQRLYPYLDITRRGTAYVRNFFGQALDEPDSPWFSHLPRWSTTAQAKHFYSAGTRAALEGGPSALDALAQRLPSHFKCWHPFNRAQYLEAKLLMGGYLLGAQGDRMLMANGVEGRFPYLDHEVIAFAATLPPRLKMKVLREKHLLRHAMRARLPEAIIARHKQPYRAPDIEAFSGGAAVLSLMEPAVVRDYGYFDPVKVQLLVRKAMSGQALGQRDNMAFIGVLTTQMWHHHFVARFAQNFGERGGDSDPYRRNEEAREARHVH